ncbi:MAG: Ig-like domain-containing domain [Fibrobacter sp.]|jgi:hypothetical protein|nr:Ig-like domain-containing domain [Fibrobacter sp.]MDY6370186.1 Ig-like domain-containing domain [Fibrobacter sp.]MDY6389755.1 Ig-like domain-containing domain [Fibrobacter sp.]
MKLRVLALLFFAFVLWNCATSVAPGGGPEDKYPPRVAGVYPAPNSTNMPLELNVHLQFDEWIATSVPRSAVMISPPLEKKLKFEVDGDELFVTSKARLDSNTTYTVTIANGLKDLRGNAVTDPFRLTFSTGPMIDSLSVKGQVMVSRAMLQKKQLPTIGLFLVGASERASHHYLEKYRDSTQTAEADSIPKLTKEQPLFSTQTDSLGRFHLAGLKAGHYRVVAFVDVNGNQKIETSAELAGVATADLILTPEYSGALWVPLADQDTTPVSLESVTQVSKNALTAKFSKNLFIDSTLLDKENCVLLTADSTRIRPTWIFRAPRSNDMQYVFDSLANADSSYTFRCAYGKDSVGRFLDSRLASLSIDWTEQKGDTLPSKMVATAPSMNAKNVFTKDSIWITYDKPLADSVLDSLRRVLILVQNQDTLPVNVFRKDPVRFAVYGNEAFLTDAKVELLERYADSTLSSPDSVTGNRDTIVTIKTRPWVKFETVPKLQLASLSGKIPGGSTDTRVRIRKADSDQFTTVSCTANGSFQMDDLTEGKYLMEYFRTKDSLNVPYAGKLFHFEHGMPWRALVDTLVIERGANVLNADIEGL